MSSEDMTFTAETGGLWRTGARYRYESLDGFFKPKAVAVVGASEKAGSVGGACLKNLVAVPFGGNVYPVNNQRPTVLGIKAYPSIAEIPEPVDLAVITTPAKTVPGVVKECVASHVKSVIIISAGFAEMGEPGHALIREIRDTIQNTPTRIVGPNCLGILNPLTGLNATFSAGNLLPGNLGFITQSGALGTTLIDWSRQQHVGFSRFVSVGTMMDVEWGDLIRYLGDDAETKAILIYMESIGDAKAFVSAAREVSRNKPIIVIKAGRTSAAAAAAVSHTGTLAGSDDVVDAAFARCGVLRVSEISELFGMARVLSKQPLPGGPNMSIVTNAGGPGVLATDALCLSGGSLAKLSPATMEILNKNLPAAWSRNNPIDILGDAPPERYAKVLETCLSEANSDGSLIILTPQEMTDPTLCAKVLIPFAKSGKPVLAAWMGGELVGEGRLILEKAGIPTFAFSDEACRAFTYMWQYRQHLNTMYEVPQFAIDAESSIRARDESNVIIEAALAEGRTILTEHESKAILRAYGMPVTQDAVATSAEAAVDAAKEFGFPVVLKIHSKTITHKTDIGGVRLNLQTADAVRQAFNEMKATIPAAGFDGVNVQPMVKMKDSYELILGSTLDVQFGPVLLFGFGGSLVEVFHDRALGLPPLNTTLARRMMEQTKIYKALKGVRGRRSVDLPALERLLVQFSNIVVAHPRLKEVDINPLVVSSELLMCLDARMVLHPNTVKTENLPRAAIRPYPVQYVKRAPLKDGREVVLRPLGPEDEPKMEKFFHLASEESVKSTYGERWHLFKDSITHQQLVTICFNDYDHDIAIAAELRDEILGVGRLSRVTGLTGVGLVGLIVRDDSHSKGVGGAILRQLFHVAKTENMTELWADIVEGNTAAEAVFTKFGFVQTGKTDVYTTWKLTKLE